MDLNSATDLKHRDILTTTETTSVRPAGPPAAGSASILKNAINPRIKNSTFNIFNGINNFTPGTSRVLDILHGRVAPHAILNAGGRADEVRCHPGTREEVIDRIERWRDAQDGLLAPIFWLSGPAGAGKTAIMQTIAERCNEQGVPHANFFFFRTDASRNSLSPLIATLLHQIIMLYPSLREVVEAVLSANPLILDSILDEQLMRLIVTPLRAAQQSSTSWHPPLLQIDGLDECDSVSKRSQRQILRAFDKVLTEDPWLFRLLVASRDESQIRAAFNEISSPFVPLYLDDQYFPESDIRVFVNDQFKQVRKTHPLSHTLNSSWPSVKDTEDIVKKSSGQFIYAATVMRFISDSSASPILSLERVQGATQIVTKSPFSHLDAVYTYILGRVDDQQALIDILHAYFFMRDSSVAGRGGYGKREVKFADLLGIYKRDYTRTRVQSCLADLTPIARYTDAGELLFHHASFPDYLLDHSRCTDYSVDIDELYFKNLSAIWARITLGLQGIAYCGLHRLRMLPPDFLDTLIALNPFDFNQLGNVRAIKDTFKHIYTLCTCTDDVIKYKQIICRWISTLERYRLENGAKSTEDPPCSQRYFVMALIQLDVTLEPRDHITIALRPETDFDTEETASWLNSLLYRIHTEQVVQNCGDAHQVRHFQELIQKWVSWAVWNNIPLNNLDNIPGARLYLRKSKLEKWVARRLNIGSRKK